MDSDSAQVALLSIHPRFAEAILNGDKRVEFRRTRFSQRVSHVVIYATLPVAKVIGWFEVAGIESLHPDDLWSKFNHCGGIDEQQFRSYYAGRETGYAIRVQRSQRLKQARSLSTICRRIRPPQSFAYLDKAVASRIIGSENLAAENRKRRAA